MTKAHSRAVWLLLAFSLTFAGCHSDAGSSAAEPAAAPVSGPAAANDPAGSAPTLVALERKVIKTGSLTLAVETPATALADARAIAERHGGYVLNSSNAASAGSDLEVTRVNVSLKVRADRFDDALADLRRLGFGTGSESVESKDVSEEYVDVEARLRTQKRVEEQYLALLRDAKNVGETLEIHKQLTIVRTEIERLEGKMRLFEHQIRLSTIDVRFEKKAPLFAIGGGRFGRAVKQAGVDAVNVGASIVIFTIRAIGILIPFGVLLLPGFLMLRWAARRFDKRRTAA
jgi:hypothetical protein